MPEYVNARITDTTYYSIGFPEENPKELIDRDVYINQIVQELREVPVVFVEGEEDSGKTTLCGQFARKYADKTISVFFNQYNLLDLDLEFYYSNVVGQIKYLLNNIDNKDGYNSYVGFEKYKQHIFQLRKKYKSTRAKTYLILDGLENVVKSNPDFIKSILDVVPFGEDIFRIIICGYEADYKSVCRRLENIEKKPVKLLGFSTPEVAKYLNIEDVISGELQELFNITHGYPGRLKTLKRLIDNENYSIDNINSTTTYKNWIELDCESVDLGSGTVSMLISIISLSKNTFSYKELSKIIKGDEQSIFISLKEIPVLEIINDNVNFASASHKKYFANQLRGRKKDVDKMLIEYYSSEDSILAKIELTKLYSEKDSWPEVIKQIDEQYIEGILENTGVIKKVNESLEIGITASMQMKSYSAMWKYSLLGSIVNEMDNHLFWESEIEARVSLNDFNGAISLADSAILKVDRFRLLALVARRQKEINNRVDEELISLINELYKLTDLYSVGDKIYDIVADLIYAIPNLAIEMIEKASGKYSEGNINDWVVAKLSIAAIDSNVKENGEKDVDKTKKLEAIQSINHPSVKKINRAISFLVGNYSALKVLDEVKKLSDSSEKLKLLRLWLNNNRSNLSNIEKVIDIALDELVSATSQSTITLDGLKDLSFQLPYIKDENIRRRVLERFYLIEQDLSDFGLTKNNYIYQLNKFHAEYTIDKGAATKLLTKIIRDVESIPDILVRLESYSEVYNKLKILRCYELGKTYRVVYSRILLLSTELFASTANHFKICQNVIKTVSKTNPILGLKICEYINTVNRRDKARILILESYLDNNLRHVKIEVLKEIERSFEDPSSNHTVILNILDRYAQAKKLHFNVIKQLLYFLRKVERFNDKIDSLIGFVMGYRIILKNENWKTKLSNNYEEKIIKYWNLLEAEWEKIDMGFKVCSSLSKINEGFSREMFEKIEVLKNNSWLDSGLAAYTYMNCLKIVIRSYSGLISSHNERKDDYSTLETLIDRVPSKPQQLQLWTEAAFSSLINAREDVGKKIYNEHLLPLIENLKDKQHNLEDVSNAIVIIHVFNSNLAVEYLKLLSQGLKERIVSKICNFYISKRSPYEAYDQSGSIKYSTSYSDFNAVISLLDYVETDTAVYVGIDEVYKAIANNKENLSRLQINTISEKLNNIIKHKLPDKRNIQHLGYLILAEFKVALLRKGSVDWSQFIERANTITNTSDQIFVKSILLENIPFEKIKSDGLRLKKMLIDEVIEKVNSFNIHYEFVQRVIDLTEVMYKVERERWKKVVNRAFSLTNKLDTGSEIYESQKRIIDSMHRIDQNFAKELIKTVDKENEENRINTLIHNHYEMLEVSNKIKNNKDITEKEKENYRMVVESIFKALRSLNSDRLVTKKVSKVSGYLPIGNKLPLHEVFPVFMYYLANCSRMYKEKDLEGTVSNIHRDNFKEAVRATAIVQLLSNKRKSLEKSYRRFIIDEDFSSNKSINPNSRDEALTFIRSWMEEEAEEFLYVVDPYFSKEGLEILKIVKAISDDFEIEILGSKDGAEANIEEVYKDYWNQISDELPPFTNITFCWIEENKNSFPIHDRWILTKNGGIRMGTSFNSLGMNKESELSIMKPSEALGILENSVIEYIHRKKRYVNNERLSYKSFSL